MVSSNRIVQLAMERSGVFMVHPNSGLSALRNAVLEPQAAVIVSIPFNWSRFMSIESNAAAPIYQEFASFADSLPPPTTLTRQVHLQSPAAPRLPETTASPSSALSRNYVFEIVSNAVSAVLGKNVDSDFPLVQSGLDSFGTFLSSYKSLLARS